MFERTQTVERAGATVAGGEVVAGAGGTVVVVGVAVVATAPNARARKLPSAEPIDVHSTPSALE